MTEIDPQSGSDIAARLVEQLTRTNDRLERLEATLREHSLLPSLQHEPETAGGASQPVGSNGSIPPNSGTATIDNAGVPLEQEAEAHFRRGVALCQAGKFDEAAAAWQQVLKLQPNNTYAMANLGIVFTEQSRWLEARDAFIRVLSLQPDNAEAHYGLGMADAQLGNYAGAVAAWENTLRLQPDFTDAHYNLALVRQRLSGDSGAPAAAASAVTASPAAPASISLSAAGSRAAPRETWPIAAGRSREVAATGNAKSDTGQTQELVLARKSGLEESEIPTEERAMVQSARPAIRQSPKPRIGLLVAAIIVVAGLLLFNNYRNSLAHTTNPAEKPAAANEHGTGIESVATPALASKAIDPTPIVHVEEPSEPAPGVLAAQPTPGPTRPGVMQIRLANGLSGPFRYWFVSSSDRAARMRPLPGASRNGIIALPIPAEYNHPGAQLRIMNVNQGKVARVSVLDISRRSVIISPNVGTNLLQNADFTQGSKGWSLETTAPARGTMHIVDGLSAPPGVPGRAVHFDIMTIGSQGWNVQCYQSGVDLKEGQPYLLSCWAKSDRNRPLHLDVILDKPDWHKVGVTTSVNITPQWHKHLFHFTPTKTEPGHSRVSFVLGEAVGPLDLAGMSLRRSNGADTAIPSDSSTAITVSAPDFN